MKLEEITLSDDLKQPASWKLWIREHWGFLAAIGCLSLISFFFLVRDIFLSENIQVERINLEPEQKPVISEPEKRKPVRKKTPMDPFEPAKTLFKQGKMDEAIAYLLKLGRRHSQIDVREKAAHLAKKYHRIRSQKKELKQKYLQGYVLFRSYPKEACGKWEEILKTEMVEDPYYQKAKKRWEVECQSVSSILFLLKP